MSNRYAKIHAISNEEREEKSYWKFQLMTIALGIILFIATYLLMHYAILPNLNRTSTTHFGTGDIIKN